jgi:RNA polymerase sigma-70 factor, ECF subfamily
LRPDFAPDRSIEGAIGAQPARSDSCEEGRLKMREARLFLVSGGAIPDEADDATLVQKLIDGHPYAARAIWQRFAPMVHRILKRSLGPDEDVEDLAQDVFICLFQKASTLREPKALKAFVIAITALTVRGELRRRWSRHWVRLQRPGPVPQKLAVYPDLESREALRRFYLILDRVNIQDRTAFVLRFMEGMALEDVAAALEVSVATAKRRLTRVWDRVVLLAERDTALVEYLSGIERNGACA